MTAILGPGRFQHGGMARRGVARALSALFAATLGALVAGPVAGQPSDGQTFKDWRVRCQQPEAAEPRQCHIFQTVVVTRTAEPILYIAVGYPPDGSDDAVVFITLPLGIHLPSGVTLRVDDGDPVGVLIEHCDRDGCHARLPLERRLVASFKAGLVAHVAFRDGVGQPL
ncbi:MAG: invasion associated locus B family protein, partial [Kiloniellales bacterium]